MVCRFSKNPLKKSRHLLNEYHRLHLVQLAIEGDKKFKASNIEFTLPKPSYTIDTLTYLKEKYQEHEFVIIMGSDSLQNISKWKNYKTLLDNYSLYVYIRPGFEINASIEKVTILKAPLLEISSTVIRELIKQGKSIKYLVPPAIEEEIKASGYYRN